MAISATNIILLTVLISVCQQTDGISLTKKELGCYYTGASFFTMKCTNSMKIHIVNSTLGRSADVCRDDSKCCPSNNVCTVDATPEHLQNLMQTCDGKETCQVTVYRQRCPVGSSTIIDFESVTYTCRDTTQATTTEAAVTTLEATTATTAAATTTAATTVAANTAAATTSKPATISVLTSHAVTVSSTAAVTTDNTVSTLAGSIASLIVTSSSSSSSTTQSTADVSSTSRPPLAAASRSSGTNAAFIGGLSTAACVVVIAAVLVVLLYRRRTRESCPPEMDKKSVQPATDLYVTMSDDMPEQTDDNYACRSTEVTALPSGVTNPTNVAVTMMQPNPTTQTVSLDDLYSKPNKQKKLDKDSQNASDYACVYGHTKGDLVENGMTGSGNEELNYIEIDHRGAEGATGDEGPHPESEAVTYAEIQSKSTSADRVPQDGDTDVAMVENDLYS